MCPCPANNTYMRRFAASSAVYGDIFWRRSYSRPILRTTNKYNIATVSFTDVSSELKTFIERFLSRVARYSRSAVTTPLGHVSKRFEELVTSGIDMLALRQTAVHFQPCVHGQRVH